MSGIELKADIRDRVTTDILKKIQRNMDNLRPALMEIGEHLQGSVEQRFRDETDPSGKDWEPLTAFTLANKRTSSILTESGGSGLRSSIHYSVSNDELVQGSNKIYAAIHQFGGIIRAKSGGALAIGKSGGKGEFALVRQVSIPARPYLGLSADDCRTIDAVLARYMQPDSAL